MAGGESPAEKDLERLRLARERMCKGQTQKGPGHPFPRALNYPKGSSRGPITRRIGGNLPFLFSRSAQKLKIISRKMNL